MSALEAEEGVASSAAEAGAEGEAEAEEVGKIAPSEVVMIRTEDALEVVYCPNCGFPPEYCSFGVNFDKCVPWIMENMIEALDEDVLTRLLGEATLDEDDVSQYLILRHREIPLMLL